MLKILFFLIVLFFSAGLFAQAQPNTDSLNRERTAFIKSQTIKSDSLNALALKLATPTASPSDLNRAIELIMSGLHTYSKFRDSTGLRETFDNLGFVYHLQKKYTQAKWFIIQSNSLSRDRADTLNIINSLINLASVKEDIKDFSLAKRDLNEALALAKSRSKIDEQINVEKALAGYYTQKGDLKDIDVALNRIVFLKDSVVKAHLPVKTVVVNITKHTITPTPPALVEDNKQDRTIFIILITITTALLASICMLFYLKSKKRNRK